MNNKETVSPISFPPADTAIESGPRPAAGRLSATDRISAPAATGRGLSEGRKIVFLKRENQCNACGNGLSTEIEYIPFTRFMVERAACRGCRTLNRVKNHSLQ